MNTLELVYISPADINPSPFNPRTKFNKDADKELLESVGKGGREAIDVNNGAILHVKLTSDRTKGGDNDEDYGDHMVSTERQTPSMANRMAFYRRRLEIHENRIEQRAQQEILTEIYGKTKAFDRPLLELLVDYILEHDANNRLRERKELFLPAAGLDPKKVTTNNFTTEFSKLRALLPKMAERQLVGLAAVVVGGAETIKDPTWRRDETPRFDVLVKHAGVSADKIRKAVAKEMAAKAPKKPVKEPAKPKVKKSAGKKKGKK